MGGFMKKLIGLMLALSLSACSTCKRTDSADVCRTKQRDHGQPHADLYPQGRSQPEFAANGPR
jgi:hypothetical protein